MMMNHLNEAECEVNDEFDVSLEPSGNTMMFIIDNFCQNDDIMVNYEEWCENEDRWLKIPNQLMSSRTSTESISAAFSANIIHMQ